MMDSVEVNPIGAAPAVAPQFSHASQEGASVVGAGVGEAHHPPTPSKASAAPVYSGGAARAAMAGPPVAAGGMALAPAAGAAGGGGGGGSPVHGGAGPSVGGEPMPPGGVGSVRTPKSAAVPAAAAVVADRKEPGQPNRPPTKEEIARITAENVAASKAKSGGGGGSVSDFFMKAAQWGLQQVGTRTASPDAPDIHNIFFRLARIEAELEELRNSALHYYNVRRVAHADRVKFDNQIAACGSHSKLGNTAASEVVRHFAAAAHKLEAYADDLDRAFYALVVNPINELLIGELRTATAIRKQYDSLHLEYDARVLAFSRLKEDPKIPETPKRVAERKAARGELDRAGALFESAKDQLKIVFGVVESKRNSVFNESLASYMKSELVAANNQISALEQHATAVASNFPTAAAQAQAQQPQPPRAASPQPAAASAASAAASSPNAGAQSADVKAASPSAAVAAAAGGSGIVITPSVDEKQPDHQQQQQQYQPSPSPSAAAVAGGAGHGHAEPGAGADVR